tara:strand:+ start:658 stop:1377 length:720 start_codon:yes stop_codon:yes gene_type:complete
MATSLVACGGGGGGGGGGSVTSPGVQSQNANGIWTGITSVAGSGYSETLAFFNDGEFVAINAYWDEFYQGNYTINGTAISSTSAKAYAVNGPYEADGSLEGIVSSEGTLRATVEGSLGTTLDVDLVYETAAYERSISLADLAGSWSGSVGGLSFAIIISPSGSFAASGSDGCSVAGELTIPQLDRNMIKGDLTISGSNCSVNGTYRGLAILANNLQANDTLFIGYSNNNYGFAYQADRN